MITFCFSRSTSFFESGIGRGMGFRDSNQDLVGFVHQIPSRARERIIDIASTQFKDGGCYHQYQPLTKRGNNDIGGGFNDDPLWLIFGVVAYVKETGDFGILDEKVPYDNVKGTEGTKYENGPSPWKGVSDLSDFTCFTNFMEKFNIDDTDTSVLVKADELMPNDSTISINLLKCVVNSKLQPMLLFSSKFSNMDGFTDVHPVLYDSTNEISITFPMNYGKSNYDLTFNDMWNKVIHLNESVDLEDYIFREVNELVSSEDAPNSLKNFIASILTESTLNINQPVKDILSDCANMMHDMKPAKKKKFSKMVGSLIGWCFVQKHDSCTTCGKIHL